MQITTMQIKVIKEKELTSCDKLLKKAAKKKVDYSWFQIHAVVF